MKKLIGLLIMSFVLALGVSAQLIIRSDASIVKYGATGDTLNLNDTITTTYYVSAFATDADLYWLLDSISGTPSVVTVLEYSYDNVKWFNVDRDTLTFVVDGDTTNVQGFAGKLYPYIRSRAIGITGAQTVKYKEVFTIKTN